MSTDIKPEALLALYNSVRAQLADAREKMPTLPAMDPETYDLEIRPEDAPAGSAEAALARLAEFKPLQGWVGFQSANRLIDERGVPNMNEQTGVLLAAEVCNAEGASMHIRYDGAGGWRVTEYRPSLGGPYLADILTHVAHKAPLGDYLRYRRFWRIDPAQGAQVHAACFIGFGDKR